MINGVGHTYITGKSYYSEVYYSRYYYYDVRIFITNYNDVDYHIDGLGYRLLSKHEGATTEYESSYSISDPIVYVKSNRTIKIKFEIGEFNSNSGYKEFIEGKTFELYFGNTKLATVNLGNLK